MILIVTLLIVSAILTIGADWLFDEANRREFHTFRGMSSPSRAAFWLRVVGWACLAAAVLTLAVTGWMALA